MHTHTFAPGRSSHSDPSSSTRRSGRATPALQRADSSSLASNTAIEQSLAWSAPMTCHRRPAHSLASLPVLPSPQSAPPEHLQYGDNALASLQTRREDLSSLIQRAHTDGAEGIGAAVRQPLEKQLGYDLSRVQVHRGPASAQAARALNAQAFTLGRDIYLGEQVNRLNTGNRTRLMVHESIRTVQQRDAPVATQTPLAVSRPTDAAEVEAEQISLMRQWQ